MIPARGGGNGVSGGGLRRFGGFLFLFFSLVLLAAVVARGCFCGRGLFFCGLEFLDVGATRIRRVEAGTFKHYAPVSYTHLRAHETRHDIVCRLLLEKKKNKIHTKN